MNRISYNFKRHIELLNHQKNLKSQDRSISNENLAEYLELLQYNAAVQNQILWEDRFEVASFIQSFLNKEINPEQFQDSVFKLRNIHRDKGEEFLSKLVSEEIK